MSNPIKIRIESENLRGLLLIKINSVETGKTIMYGTYRGVYEGRILLPPESELTTEIIAEAHKALIAEYADSVWTLHHDKDSNNYKEMKAMFENAGIQVV